MRSDLIHTPYGDVRADQMPVAVVAATDPRLIALGELLNEYGDALEFAENATEKAYYRQQMDDVCKEMAAIRKAAV